MRIFIDLVKNQNFVVFLSILKRTLFDEIGIFIKCYWAFFVGAFNHFKLFDLVLNEFFDTSVAKGVFAGWMKHHHMLFFNLSKTNWAFNVCSKHADSPSSSLPFLSICLVYLFNVLYIFIVINVLRAKQFLFDEDKYFCSSDGILHAKLIIVGSGFVGSKNVGGDNCDLIRFERIFKIGFLLSFRKISWIGSLRKNNSEIFSKLIHLAI